MGRAFIYRRLDHWRDDVFYSGDALGARVGVLVRVLYHGLLRASADKGDGMMFSICEGGSTIAEIGMPIWYIILFLGVVALAVFTRSIIANVAVIILGVVAGAIIMEWDVANEVIKYGAIVGMYSIVGFALFEIVFRARRL